MDQEDNMTEESTVNSQSCFYVNMYDRIKRLKRGFKSSSQNITKDNVNKERKTTKAKVANTKQYSKKTSGSSPKSDDLVAKIGIPENLKLKNLRVNLKRCHKLKLNSRKTKTHQRKEGSIFLNPHPKTVKDFQNNDRLLACFNDGHSDDMFSHQKAPSHISQMNLEDSFSDQDQSPGGNPKTPLVNYVKSFEGWAQQTPADLRKEEDRRETPGQFKHCAFLRKALREKRSKKLFKKSSGTKNVSAAKSSNDEFATYLSKLKPALEESNGSEQSDSEDELEEMEPYFEDE